MTGLQRSRLKTMTSDKKKSLQELESEDWGPPAYDCSLVTRCHELRRKPLCEFTTKDLRIMIGQQIGLQYLVPVAVERLSENPLASGDFYNGFTGRAIRGFHLLERARKLMVVSGRDCCELGGNKARRSRMS
jgi:hypothetical protein